MAEASFRHVSSNLSEQGNRLPPAEPRRFTAKSQTFSTEYQQSRGYSSNTSIPLVTAFLLQKCVDIFFM